uniref:Small integral membrane protein 15 n=1 Tax=Tetranychus urticae TaxID=32264 RepID=T1KKL7_TETUR
MVDLSGGPEGPIEHRFSNWIFVGPAIITIALVGFFAYKLIQSLQEKEKRKEEKKKLKQQKKDPAVAAKKKK